MKRNKNKVILFSIVVLLPMVIGLLIWNQLPKDVATHFSFNGQPDGYSSKEFAVFVLPLIIFVIHLFCIFAVSTDPKSKNINNKMYSIILWICPLVSVFICNCIYGYTLGFIKNIGFITGLLLGTLYIVLGNYLPTVKPNYTVGIRVPWTLNDQDNWYHTHRFSGKCMVLGGVLLIMLLPFMDMFILFTLALVPGILPIIYSYLYHRKKAR